MPLRLASPVLGPAPRVVSRVRRAAGAGGRAGPGSAHPARGPLSPARAASLSSTARASRAAVPEAVQSWRRRAGSQGSVASSLGVPGTFTGSRGVLGCFPPLQGQGELPFRLWGCPGGRARGSQAAARARDSPAAAVGPLPGARCLAFRQRWESAKQASCLSRPPSRLPFFPVLQILGSSSSGNAGRKSAREGGGGWKFLAALCWSVRSRRK